MNNLRSIEDGYFIFTLMPSLRCSLNCPHCYLSLEQRRNSQIMSLERLEAACRKVYDYYRDRGINKKKIICYWYGGEPTQMPRSIDGKEYVVDAASMMSEVFRESEGYDVKHTILTSLVTIEDHWFDIFRSIGKGYVQSSFDWMMRGKGYMRKWEKKARELVAQGIDLATISVVNRELMDMGPSDALEYLSNIGVVETSWLPFMLNEQNEGDKYNRFAPSMKEYDEFMIELSKTWIAKRKRGEKCPEIGQMRFILGQSGEMVSNIAGQTLFLLPNGDFALPDYKEGRTEFLRSFGNIFTDSFQDILSSEGRRKYLRKQVLRNGNAECLSCDLSDRCLMEFWKDNRSGDDCFGAKRYVNWLLKEVDMPKEHTSVELY